MKSSFLGDGYGVIDGTWRVANGKDLSPMHCGLVPVALSYGADPAGMLPKLLKFNVETPNERQVFRALMCLYLASSAFWVMAALTPEWQTAGLIWAVLFMLSLALGRLLSIVLTAGRQRRCSISTLQLSLQPAH